MDRTEIEQEYQVKDGIIISPGKFENEPIYAPHFYNVLQEVGADDTEYDGDIEGNDLHYFNVEQEDLDNFPELEGIQRVCLFEDSLGFVYVRAV